MPLSLNAERAIRHQLSMIAVGTYDEHSKTRKLEDGRLGNIARAYHQEEFLAFLKRFLG